MANLKKPQRKSVAADCHDKQRMEGTKCEAGAMAGEEINFLCQSEEASGLLVVFRTYQARFACQVDDVYYTLTG